MELQESKKCDSCVETDVKVMKESLYRIENSIIDRMSGIEKAIEKNLDEIKNRFNGFEKDFSDFKVGIGKRIQDTEHELTVTKTRLSGVLWVVGVFLGAIITGLVMRKL